MAAKKEPEYMELKKGTKETEPHIYELDVPKVPRSLELAGDENDQTFIQYHYVKNTATRGIKVPIPCDPEEEERKKIEQHQYHYVESTEKKRVRPLSNLASQEVRSKIQETLQDKIKDRGKHRHRKCSIKCMAITMLLLLTLFNTIMATAALILGGLLYSRVSVIQRQINGTIIQGILK